LFINEIFKIVVALLSWGGSEVSGWISGKIYDFFDD